MIVQLALAGTAGLLSFFSPCMLPLVPVYLSRITGLEAGSLQGGQRSGLRIKVIFHTLLFVCGISVIYLALGYSASFIGRLFIEYQKELRIGSGLLMLVMGLVLLGLISPSWLLRERRLNITGRTGSYAGSFILGIGFAAGWTPCIGPMLSSIVGLSASEPETGMLLMLVYIAGFTIPFLGFALFYSFFKKWSKMTGVLSRVGGGIFIAFGVLLLLDKLSVLSLWLNEWFNFQPVI